MTRTCEAPGCGRDISHRARQARTCSEECSKARRRAEKVSAASSRKVLFDTEGEYFEALDADRGYINWRPQSKTRIMLGRVQQILEEYSEHLPLTCRQIYYRMVAEWGYEKGEMFERSLYGMLKKARRAGEIPFHHIRDDGISGGTPVWYTSIDSALDNWGAWARNFDRDVQEGQDVRVIAWCEAAGMLPQLERVAAPYSVPVYSCGGFTSLTAVRWIVDTCLTSDVPTVLLHLGDADPSGRSIFQAMFADAAEFLADDQEHEGQRLDARLLALTREQIDEFKIPLDPIKTGDSRSEVWRSRGLTEKAELEALPPDAIATVLRDAIEDVLDMDLVEDIRAEQAEDRVTLGECAEVAATAAMLEPAERADLLDGRATIDGITFPDEAPEKFWDLVDIAAAFGVDR
ncbi:MAG TPA: hypothetical protein VFW09_17810 [Solirubrobacteraceae bacterium]|nr:hypothetical protein [Solirubrobacteraceae bacterium]